jgi:hypothetical protein
MMHFNGVSMDSSKKIPTEQDYYFSIKTALTEIQTEFDHKLTNLCQNDIAKVNLAKSLMAEHFKEMVETQTLPEELGEFKILAAVYFLTLLATFMFQENQPKDTLMYISKANFFLGLNEFNADIFTKDDFRRLWNRIDRSNDGKKGNDIRHKKNRQNKAIAISMYQHGDFKTKKEAAEHINTKLPHITVDLACRYLRNIDK